MTDITGNRLSLHVYIREKPFIDYECRYLGMSERMMNACALSSNVQIRTAIQKVIMRTIPHKGEVAQSGKAKRTIIAR